MLETTFSSAPAGLALTVGLTASELGAAARAADWRKTQVALGELRDLPSLRGLARRFAQTVEQDYCLLDEVVAEVERDPALTLNVLRRANSAATGVRERVVDLEQALQLLGVARVRLMAQLQSALDDARALAPGFDWSHLWMHSAACAALADRIDHELGLRLGPVAHLAALLHDVGKIALSAVAPQAYRSVLVAAWSTRAELPALEEAWLGLDHREAGWIVGQEADLSPLILSVIAHHDSPERAPEEHRLLVATVATANRLARAHGLGFSGNGAPVADTLAEGAEWRALEAAAGRGFDARAMEELCVTDWLPPIRAELRAMRSAELA